jgi:hypothetical protein
VDNRRQLALVVVLVAMVALLSLLVAPDADRGGIDPRPSSFRAADPGTLALFLVLDELGIPVERRLTSWIEGEPLDGPLVLLAPSQPLTPLEVDSLLAWVEAGGALIYAARPGDPLLEALGLVLVPLPDTILEPRARPRPHPWTEGTREVRGFRWLFADTSQALADRAATPLLVLPGGGVVALTERRGEGQVVAWSDPRPLDNGRLRESGAAVFFARVATGLAGEGGRLGFDEFHHGYRAGIGVVRSTLRFLRDTGPGRMALQIGVAALGLLVLAGRRFGTPYPPAEARRRSPLEHVEALAGAYRQGGARTVARHQVVAGLARRIGRAPPPAGAEAVWLATLAARLPAAGALLDEWNRGERADLVTLAGLADRLVAHLRYRTPTP